MNRVSVILLCITTLAIFLMLRQKPKLDIQKYEDEIKILQMEIDGLEVANSDLKVKAAVLNQKVQQYDSIIENLTNEISIIQDETQKKLDSVDRYNRDQLQRFFSKRYHTN